MSDNEQQISQRVTEDKIGPVFSNELKFIGNVSTRCKYIRDTETVLLEEMNSKLPNNYKIGNISLDLKVDDFEPVPRHSLGTEYILHTLTRSSFNRVANSLIKNVRKAVTEGCQFICVNELGYPACACGTSKEIQKADEIRSELLKLAKDEHCYIIAGTHHCVRTAHNYALLFAPSVAKSRGKRLSNPQLYAKQTCAQSTKEVIRIPNTSKIPVYVTQYGRIAILICLDTYDPSHVVSMVRAKHLLESRDDDIDIVFVPAFNPHPGSGNPAAKDLSYLIPSIVVHTNTQEYGGQSVYSCGEPVTKARRVSEELRIYTLNLALHKKKADALKRDRTNEFRRLFGLSSSSRR